MEFEYNPRVEEDPVLKCSLTLLRVCTIVVKCRLTKKMWYRCHHTTDMDADNQYNYSPTSSFIEDFINPFPDKPLGRSFMTITGSCGPLKNV